MHIHQIKSRKPVRDPDFFRATHNKLSWPTAQRVTAAGGNFVFVLVWSDTFLCDDHDEPVEFLNWQAAGLAVISSNLLEFGVSLANLDDVAVSVLDLGGGHAATATSSAT